MRSIIKEIWRENITWSEDNILNTPEMKELLGYINRHNDDLLKTMTDEQKDIFEKFHDCWGEYASLAEAAVFERAFKLGARFMLDITCE